MEYCDRCGELVEGRFCRMCGAPTALARAQAAVPAAGGNAGYPDGGPGYGAAADRSAPAAAPAAVAQATAYFAAVDLPGAGYGPGDAAEGTEPMPSTPSEFDGFFRPEDGAPSPHAHTRLLPPVPGDYRMPPPEAAEAPPGGPAHPDYVEDPEDPDDARHRRILMFGTLGAVVLAAAIILGMLYLGGSGGPATDSAGATTTSSAGLTPTVSATDDAGTVVVPTASAGSIPTTAAPHTSSPAVTFTGDSLPLGPGSHGQLVTYVQRRLQQLGYYHGAVSGTFDQATASAVQQFQASAQVTGDAASTVGRHTMVALIAAGSTPNLRTGTRSADVSRLDEALNEALGTHITVSNRYNSTTTTEVMRYQTAVGLPPTGQMDGATWAALQSGRL